MKVKITFEFDDSLFPSPDEELVFILADLARRVKESREMQVEFNLGNLLLRPVFNSKKSKIGYLTVVSNVEKWEGGAREDSSGTD